MQSRYMPGRMKQKDAAEIALRIAEGKATADDMADAHILPAAVDLRAVPREGWDAMIMRSVTLPPEVVRFVDGQQTFTMEERDGLEDRIAAHHGVTPPYYISVDAGPPFDAMLMKEA